MSSNKIKYKIGEAKYLDIVEHFKKCDSSFSPLLSSYVNIEDYSKKIEKNAITFEAWAENKLVGLVACYLNDKENLEGYITNVSVLDTYSARGIGKQLLLNCEKYSYEQKFKSLTLEVEINNDKAISLYRKNGFILDKKVGEKHKMNKRINEVEPLVSICCATYNHENYIRAALEGFMKQKTDFPFEVLIHDDASTDSTTEIIKEFELKYPEIIKPIYQTENQYSKGASISATYIFPRAKGKYIAICEGDDFWTDVNKLQTQIDFLEKNQKFSACFHPINWLENGKLANNLYSPIIEKDYYDENDVLENILHITLCSTVFKKSSLKNSLEYFRKIPYADNLIHILNARNGFIGYINKPMATYRRHSGGVYSGASEYKRVINTIRTLNVIKDEFNYHSNPYLKKRLSLLYQEMSVRSQQLCREIGKISSVENSNGNKRDSIYISKGTTQEDAVELFNSAIVKYNKEQFSQAKNDIESYRNKINYNHFEYYDNRTFGNPKLSIVIVAYNTNELLLTCLDSVYKNNSEDYELIVVDNGGNNLVEENLKALSLLYLKCPTNLILSEGRNIGVSFASGKIVAFLDDDAIVPENYVSTIIEAFEKYNIVGLRGKVIPKTADKNNKLALHYDLGDIPIPASVNTEGNSAFLRKEYLEVGGMNPLLFGGEGTELSFRLAKLYSEYCTIYWPKTIIYHDFANTDEKLSKKSSRHNLMNSFMVYLHPTIFEYFRSISGHSLTEASRIEGEQKIKRQHITTEMQLVSNNNEKHNIIMFWYQNDWGIYGRRNEMLAKTLAKNANINKVIHIEPPINLDDFENHSTNSLDANIEMNKLRFNKYIDDGVITYTPTYRGLLSEEKMSQIFSAINSLITGEEIDKYILWLYPPHFMSSFAIQHFSENAQLVVSDCVDDHRIYAQNEEQYKSINNSYVQILSSSDLCFSVSEKLKNDFIKTNSNFVFIPNAVKKSLLGYKCKVKPKKLENIKSPIIGYTGALSFRLDTELIEEMATKKKEWNFVFIGTSPSANLLEISKKENVHILPPVKHDEIKKYISAFDVCMIPHEVNEISDAMNPLKLFEYLALDKPIVTTNISGLNEFKNNVSIANSSDGFIESIKQLLELRSKDPQSNNQLIKNHTWEERTRYIMKLINNSIKAKSFDSTNQTNNYFAYSRPEVQKLVNPKAKKILDVGCGAGQMASELKVKLDAEVWGIELVKEPAMQASKKLDKVLIGKIEDVLNDLPDNYFDTIIFADVLEHLTDPNFVLIKIKDKLNINGEIVASIPNVRHWSVLLDLIEGNWEYADAGILDKTHYRFFTRNSIIKMFKDVGLSDYELTAVNLPPTNAEHLKVWKNFNKSISGIGLNTSSLAEEGTHYQYLIKAKTKTELVSIVIPAFNQWDYTKQTIESIQKLTENKHEIIVVDNASSDSTIKELKNYKDVKVIANEENLGFPKAVNQGILEARGNYILIANNDIVFTENWLERMVEIAKTHPEVGIVGPISNSASGRQFDKNAKYKSIPEMHKYAARTREENKGQFFQFPRVAFLCTLIKKEVIDKIGGLDERFSPGNFEDDDFCLRAQMAGYKTVIATDVFIHHYGSVSFKADGESKYAKRLETNKQKFIDKWGSDPEEIWIKGNKPKQRETKYSINSDLFIQHIERAFINIDENELSLAIGDLEIAISNFKDSERKGFENLVLDELVVILGNLYFATNNLEKAKETFEAALNENPNSSQACQGLGEIFQSIEEFDAAKTMFEWAIKNDEANEIAFQKLAIVNNALGLDEKDYSLSEEKP